MNGFLQLHGLTYVPPSNMNRDDQNRPKTAIIGGETRLRLSSQSLKRAWRTSSVFEAKLEGHLGHRTQRMGGEIMRHLEENGIAPEKALPIAREVAGVFGKVKEAVAAAPVPTEDGRKPKKPKVVNVLYTEQLAFVSDAERRAACEHALDRAQGRADAIDGAKLAARILRRADGAADVAMFGRMYADNPAYNREAAVQVAHATTTHKVRVDDDYYTAVDDLKRPEEDAGAGFVGSAGFGAGVFYTYACVDLRLLRSNLAGDADTARASVQALVEAFATVYPSAKRAAFGSYPRAGFLMLEHGTAQPRTLASAYSRGVQGDIMLESVDALTATRDQFDAAYGKGDVTSYVMDVHGGRGTLADALAFAASAGA